MRHLVSQFLQLFRVVGREHHEENERRRSEDHGLAQPVQYPKEHAQEKPSPVGPVEVPELYQKLDHARSGQYAPRGAKFKV